MSGVYTYFKDEYSRGDFVWDTAEGVKVMLVTTGYNFFPDHHFVSQASQYEVIGTNYVGGYGGSGRKPIENRSIYADLTNNLVYFRGNDISWANISVGIVGGAIVIKEIGGYDTTSSLVAYINDGGFPKRTRDTALNLIWNSLGIFKI